MTRASLRHLVDDNEGLLILDGGLGSAVSEIVPNLDKKLWSGGLVIDNPAAISAVHKKFLSAGADIITTASYQLSFDGLMESRGLGYNEALKVFQKSTYLAQNSVATFIASSIRGVSNGHRSTIRNVPLVASSVGCYGAYLADGSEYSGIYDKSITQLVEWHSSRYQVLADTNPDIMACETVPCKDEIKALLKVIEKQHNSSIDSANSYKIPAWITFACSNSKQLNSGESIEDVVRFIEESSIIDSKYLAIGVNCSKPVYIKEIVQTMRDYSKSRVIVVYPNLGETWDGVSKTWTTDSDSSLNGDSSSKDMGCLCRVPSNVCNTCDSIENHNGFYIKDSIVNINDDYVDMASSWHEAGANIIGGCCRVTPDTILRLRQRFKN